MNQYFQPLFDSNAGNYLLLNEIQEEEALEDAQLAALVMEHHRSTWGMYARSEEPAIAGFYQDPRFPARRSIDPFTFDQVDEHMHEWHFRFDRTELDELAFALGLFHDRYELENRSIVNRHTLLGVYLDYLAYPKVWEICNIVIIVTLLPSVE